MKKIFIIFSICVLFISCEKPIGGPVPNSAIDVLYTDKNNLNLLNPENPSAIIVDDIDVYLLTPKNERRRLYRGNLDMPEMFRIVKGSNDDYMLTIFFEPDVDCIDKNNIATMYLTYKNGTDDKFVGQFNRTKFPRSLEKLWVNDKLVWTISSSSHRTVTIIK